jgi:large subunit ribosomal protein L13
MQVYDAEGMILGRFASHIAKLLIENEKAGKGEDIFVVNAEKSVIVGAKDAILNRYLFLRDVGTARKGPFYPRMPDRILKRTIRGMIPYQTPRGRIAFKRLRVYIGIPREFADEQIKPDQAVSQLLNRPQKSEHI